MEFLRMVNCPKAIVLDNDGTLHNCEGYLEAGRRAEFKFIAESLRVKSLSEAENTIKARRLELGRDGNKATMTQAVSSFGISSDKWNKARETCYRPELLQRSEEIVSTVEALSDRYKVAVASNNPKLVTIRALHQLGFDGLMDRLTIVGPEDVGTDKADPDYFIRTAKLLGEVPEACIVVGDRREADGDPAMMAGMGSILVSSPKDTRQVLCMLKNYQRQFDGLSFLRGGKDGISVLGMTGRAGAGKTTLARKLVQVGREQGLDTEYLSLDAFFRLSSRERKVWLEEAKNVNDAEYQRRADQMNWWDFDRCEESVDCLNSGRVLHLERVYNRDDGGELTGVVHIEPREGLRVVMEGVALAHMAHLFCDLSMLHASSSIRKGRLGSRDKHRQGREIEERFRITEQFESNYFAQYATRATTHIDNTNGVPVVISEVPDYLD